MRHEIAPGVVIDHDGNCPEVYISDDQGEIVMWTFDEIAEDPQAWTASLKAVAMASREGPSSIRTFFDAIRAKFLS